MLKVFHETHTSENPALLITNAESANGSCDFPELKITRTVFTSSVIFVFEFHTAYRFGDTRLQSCLNMETDWFDQLLQREFYSTLTDGGALNVQGRQFDSCRKSD